MQRPRLASARARTRRSSAVGGARPGARSPGAAPRPHAIRHPELPAPTSAQATRGSRPASRIFVKPAGGRPSGTAVDQGARRRRGPGRCRRGRRAARMRVGALARPRSRGRAPARARARRAARRPTPASASQPRLRPRRQAWRGPAATHEVDRLADRRVPRSACSSATAHRRSGPPAPRPARTRSSESASRSSLNRAPLARSPDGVDLRAPRRGAARIKLSSTSDGSRAITGW